MSRIFLNLRGKTFSAEVKASSSYMSTDMCCKHLRLKSATKLTYTRSGSCPTQLLAKSLTVSANISSYMLTNNK